MSVWQIRDCRCFSPHQLRTVLDRVGDCWNRKMAASNAHVSLTTVHTTFWAEWHFREEKRRCLVTSSCCPCCTPHVSADGGASQILGIPGPSAGSFLVAMEYFCPISTERDICS